MQAIKIEPGCKPELTEMPNTLRAFQQAVGGHIEAHTITRNDLPAIVAQVRSAGNPQMAAMEAVADNEYLVDSELLEALGVASFGDLPTTPYPDAPMRTQPDSGGQAAPSPDGPRKKPGPKPGAKSKRGASQNAPDGSGTLRDALGRALGGLEEFASVWEGVLSDPHGPFSPDQVEALAQLDEAASIWLSGWDAATLMLTGGNDRDN